jgi:hypothetical protein
VLLISGTEVEDPTPAVPPSVPANSVGFFLVFVDDSGITAFQEFALSSFVRFDVNNQNLSAVQRQNARTNIQALSRDTNDSRTGTLTQNGQTSIIDSRSGSSGITFQIFGNTNTNVLSIQPRGDTIHNVYSRGSLHNSYVWQVAGTTVLRYGTGASLGFLGANVWQFQARAVSTLRSNIPEGYTRRDELPFNYPETVATTGIINDLELANEGVKLLILTLADELTGVVPVTTNTGRELKIESRVAGGTIIRHDSASSTAANRFSLPSATDLTINENEIYTFIYTNGRWRRVL